MKKTYIAPTVKSFSLEPCAVIATSPTFDIVEETDESNFFNPTETFSIKHTWDEGDEGTED